MRAAETERYRARLQSLRSELEALETDSESGVQTVDLDQSCTGRLTRMDAMQAQQMNLAGQHSRQNRLRLIDAALKRLAEGLYGDCETCDEPIDLRRLDIDPSLTRCIHCAQ